MCVARTEIMTQLAKLAGVRSHLQGHIDWLRAVGSCGCIASIVSHWLQLFLEQKQKLETGARGACTTHHS